MTDVTAGLSRPKIPVWRTAYDAYRLGLGAIFSSGKMFRFFVYGSALSIAILMVQAYSMLWTFRYLDQLNADIIGIAINFGVYCALAVVQAPLGIAVQRWVLADEQPDSSYLAGALDRRGRFYLLASLAIAFPYFLASQTESIVDLAYFGGPLIVSESLASIDSARNYVLLLLLILTAGYVGASLISAKGAFLFPAVAISRRASVYQFLSETRGTVSRLCFVFLIALIPVTTVGLFALGVAYQMPGTPLMDALSIGDGVTNNNLDDLLLAVLRSPTNVVALVVGAAAYMTWFLVIAAGAARAYQIRVERGLSGVAEVFS